MAKTFEIPIALKDLCHLNFVRCFLKSNMYRNLIRRIVRNLTEKDQRSLRFPFSINYSSYYIEQVTYFDMPTSCMQKEIFIKKIEFNGF